MADIRALLRNELASRPTTDSRGPSNTGSRVVKKRKLNAEEGLVRKRTKPTQEELPTQHEVGEQIVLREVSVDRTTADISPPLETTSTRELPKLFAATNTVTPQTPLDSAPQVVDEDEWAAFEREVAAPTRIQPAAVTGLSTAATISAAPISAAELSARGQQDAASRSGTRELDALGEQEDAARHLEEEFDEMDQLEGRVKRLKEMREDIRRRKLVKEDGDVEVEVGLGGPHYEDDPSGYESEAESEGNEADDGWYNWRLR